MAKKKKVEKVVKKKTANVKSVTPAEVSSQTSTTTEKVKTSWINWMILWPFKSLSDSSLKAKATEGNEHPIFRGLFVVLAALLFITMQWLSMDSGVNGDERFHIPQGESYWKFYKSGGSDQSFMKKKADGGDMVGETTYRYGGLIDVNAAAINDILGNDSKSESYRQVRYSLIAICGFVGMLFVGLLVRYLTGSWLWAIIGMLFLFASPRFTGHAIMNPKDLPYAAFYAMSLYYLVRFLKEIPGPKWSTVIGLTIAVALGINVRIGNVIVLAYAGMFTAMVIAAGLFFGKGKDKDLKTYFPSLIRLGVVFVGGYLLGLIFWPYGLLDPINNPREALTGFTNFHTNLTVFYDGIKSRAANLSWDYIPKWIIATSPILVLIGVLPFLWASFNKRGDLRGLLIYGLLTFAIVFPVGYVVYKESLLYCAWRHLLFVYPPIVVAGVVGWHFVTTKLKKPMIGKVLAGIMVLSMLWPMGFIAQNKELSYTYFNLTQGHTAGAFDKWETDYWMLGVKDAVTFLAEERGLAETQDTVTVITDCWFPTRFYLDNVTGYITLRMARTFYNKDDIDWDYGIFFARDVDQPELENNWPPDNTIYSVEAGGAPVVVVLERTSDNVINAYEALGKGRLQLRSGINKKVTVQDVQDAVEYFRLALEEEPNNVMLHYEKGMAHIRIGDDSKGFEHFNRALQLNPDNFQVNYGLYQYYTQVGNVQQANVFANKVNELQQR